MTMTTEPTSYATPTADRLVARLTQLCEQAGFVLLDQAGFDSFCAQPGEALILFAEDPQKVPETWDMSVILPELVKSLALPLRVGLLPPEAARALAPRYGIRLWPALLALRQGDYLGAIEGLKDWAVYRSQLNVLLAGTTSRPPSVGIPVHTAGAVGAAASCH